MLRELPELNLVQNGGPGRNATVFLRGGGSEHVLVMIDGLRLTAQQQVLLTFLVSMWMT